MRELILSVAVFSGMGILCAQPLLEQVGGGVSAGITGFGEGDQVQLHLCGYFTHAAGEDISPGIALWDGLEIASLGCGIEWGCVQPIAQTSLANPALSVVTWNGERYLGGSIDFTRDGSHYQGIMRWDGTDWHPVGGGTDGKVTSLRVIDGQLIVAGWFVHAGDLEVNGLARWDGEEWHEVVPVPAFDPNGSNYINDMAYYQGQWYIGGNLNYVDELVRWDGSTWETVGGGFTGAFAQVNKLLIHDGQLFITGSFGQCSPNGVPSNPGSGIVAWDGSTWNDLGGGTCGSLNGEVIGMATWNEELYVCGKFNRIGGVQGGKLAKWDGEQWCMLLPEGHIPNGGPNALAVYNDSLYVGGSFSEAGGEPVSCFAKWLGGDEVVGCGVLTGVEGTPMPTTLLWVTPNPASDRVVLSGLPPSAVRTIVLDALGRQVRATDASPQLDVRSLASGPYHVVVLDAQGQALGHARFVRE